MGPLLSRTGETVESGGLTENFEIADELDWHLDTLDSPEYHVWIALDSVDEPSARLARVDATFAGFVASSLEAAPEAFAWPDRLVIGDFYVREPYRGDRLADKLIERAVQVTRGKGCSELRRRHGQRSGVDILRETRGRARPIPDAGASRRD